jgi:hypothetical protein
MSNVKTKISYKTNLTFSHLDLILHLDFDI